MMPAASLKLCILRSELQFTIHRQGADRWYSVHDPLNGQFYRLGTREYLLASLFRDGVAPEAFVDQLTEEDHRRIGIDRPVTTEEVTQLASWLLRSGLCQTTAQLQAKSPYKEWILNPLSMRIPLISGIHLERACSWLTPILGSATLLAMFAVYLIALVVAVSNWQIFGDASSNLFVSDGQLWWLLAWLVLKVAHEIGHAAAAVRVGSNIRAAGINIMYFAPIPYVDVSDLWTIPNKWHRIICSAAGILTEMFLASLAVLVAVNTQSESLRYFCCAVAVTGTITTLAFNANPLMRFDGYFILSDLLNIPNLWTQAQTSFSSLVQRVVFPWSRSTRSKTALTYAAYGGASFIYRWMITLTMAATAILMWDSLGIVLVLWVAFAIYINPRIQSFRKLLSARKDNPLAFTWKEQAWCVGVVTFAIAGLIYVPSPVQPSAPGVVTFHEPVHVNAECQGILDQLHVSVGSQVRTGDLIAVLADPNLRVEYAKKQIEAQSVHESIRAEQSRGKLAELQSAQSRLESLQFQLSQLESRIQRLEVRAPQDGIIVHLSVNNCLGRKVESGESICMLAQSHELEAKVSACQRDFEPFYNSTGQSVLIHCVGSAQQLGTISKVDPKGNLYLSEPLLAGCYNGPIPVELENSPSSGPQWKLSAPRFDIHIRIPADSALVPGQLVWVKVPGHSSGILGVVSSWLKSQWNSLRTQIKSQA